VQEIAIALARRCAPRWRGIALARGFTVAFEMHNSAGDYFVPLAPAPAKNRRTRFIRGEHLNDLGVYPTLGSFLSLGIEIGG
jgi:hypothetical protein